MDLSQSFVEHSALNFLNFPALCWREKNMHHRSQATRAVLAASAHYWRMHINARQSLSNHGARPFKRMGAGPCKQAAASLPFKLRQD